jgi:DNA-binding transcriptional regulator YhcF (GntR family)
LYAVAVSLHESAVSGSPPEVPYLRIAWELRHDIEQGTFEAGAQLPTQAALVRRFDVSRATVQRALDELRRDGWIDSQQGRGSYVLDRSAAHTAPEPAGVGLTDHIDAAFEADRITLDSFSFTSETLNSALQEPLRRVRRGELRPESIAVRLLLPSPDVRLALPKAVGDADDDRPLRRLRRLTISQAVTVQSAVGALADSGHVADVRVDIRTVPLTPMHKHGRAVRLLRGRQAHGAVPAAGNGDLRHPRSRRHALPLLGRRRGRPGRGIRPQLTALVRNALVNDRRAVDTL